MTRPPDPAPSRFSLCRVADAWRQAFYVALVRAGGPALRWEGDGPSQWGSCYEIGTVGQLAVAKFRFADHPPRAGTFDDVVFALDCRLPLLADAAALLRMAPCPWQMGTRAAPLFSQVAAEWTRVAGARQPGLLAREFIQRARAHLNINVAVWTPSSGVRS